MGLLFFRKTKFRFGGYTGELEYEIEPVIPLTETRKPQLCEFPDGWGGYIGSKPNSNGRYDLHFTDGQVRRNVDPDENILVPDNILAVLAGSATFMINITKDGKIIDFSKWLGMRGNKHHLSAHIDDLERRARTGEIQAKATPGSTRAMADVEQQAEGLGRIQQKIRGGAGSRDREQQVEEINEDDYEVEQA